MLFAVACASCLLSAPPVAQPAATAPDPSVDRGKYFVVPLQGEFGKDITAPGVAQAIKIARQKRAGTVVFEIDSPGGFVEDADAIAKVMDDAKLDLKFVSVIKRAFSASMWVAAHSDVVAFEPGGPAGAAVCYHKDPRTGNAEVDAKLNAAFAASLAAAAEARGQAGAVYRAMVLQSVELFQCEENGKITLTNEPEFGTRSACKRIDDRETVLALTPDQAASIGFGIKVTGPNDAAIAKLLAIQSWEAVSPASNGRSTIKFGADAVAFEKRALERNIKTGDDLRNDYKASKAEVTRLIGRAKSLAPDYTPVYYTPEGNLSSESQTRWRNQCDSAIGAWEDVLTELRRASKLQEQITANASDINKQWKKFHQTRRISEPTDTVEPPDFAKDNMELDKHWKDSEDALADIRARRNRNRVER